jgi:hypothetical protein
LGASEGATGAVDGVAVDKERAMSSLGDAAGDAVGNGEGDTVGSAVALSVLSSTVVGLSRSDGVDKLSPMGIEGTDGLGIAARPITSSTVSSPDPNSPPGFTAATDE